MDATAKDRFDNAMAQMKGALPEPRLRDSTVPFRPYSCDIDGDSDKVRVGVRVRIRARARFRCSRLLSR